MQNNPDLQFRRQFIASSKKIELFKNWDNKEFPEENLFIYAHPDCEITTALSPNNNIKLALIGYVFDPNCPNKQNIDIIDELVSQETSIDSLSQKISNLAGRYIFVICIDNLKYVMNDMCGLRTVYYSLSDDQFHLASNPALLKKIIQLKPSKNYKIYTESKYYKNDIEYWLPSGLTLYDNVDQLVPNHYLDLNKHKQIRYWPYKKIKKQNLEEAAQKTANLLENLILSANNRFKLALPLTAGWDSRVLLATSKKYINDIYIYTLQFRWFVDDSSDIKIPKSITRKFGIPYNKLDCRKEMDPEFYKIYKSNVDLAHDDWAKISNGMKDEFPNNRVVLKGNGSEIARCSLYPTGKHNVTSANQLPVWNPEFLDLDFILEYLDIWMKDAQKICESFNVDIIDLFYMEILMGGWQAQWQLEWNIIQEEFTPYNYRPLIETMLGVPIKYRLHDKPILYQEIIKQLWPELLYWPCNPPSWNKKYQFKYYIADKLKAIGLYKTGLIIYHSTHPIYLKLKGYKKRND
jgi:hypothetical protein